MKVSEKYMKKVSIIIPAHKYVENIITVISDNNDDNVEWIIIDDSGKGIYKKKIMRGSKCDAIIIQNDNRKGAGISRNKGINAASGKYLYFLDSDDEFIGIELILELYNLAETNKADMVGGNILIKNENGTIENINPKFNVKADGFLELSDFQSDYGFTRFLYLRQFLEENNLKFPNLQRYEDPVFLLDCLLCNPRIYYTLKLSYIINEHKKILWSVSEVNDLQEGIYNNIVVGYENGLNDIVRDNIRRIFADFGHVWFLHQQNDNCLIEYVKQKCLLQNILFPYDTKCADYYFLVDNNVNYRFDIHNYIHINNTIIRFSSFINSFNCNLWRTYTDVASISLVLEVEGKGTCKLYSERYENGKIGKNYIAKYIIDAPTRRYVHFDYQSVPDNGILAFDLESSKELIVYDGFYINNFINDIPVKYTKIWKETIGTVLYARERFVLEDADYRLREIQKSFSYKIGLAITFIPRVLKRSFWKIKNKSNT